jgi:hypothetical protein
VSEAEFENVNEVHTYVIKMAPGDVLSVTGIPVGKYLGLGISLFEPTGQKIGFEDYSAGASLGFTTEELSGRGEYKILIRNFSYGGYKSRKPNPGTAGLYQLQIGCKKRDGTMIEPKLS